MCSAYVLEHLYAQFPTTPIKIFFLFFLYNAFVPYNTGFRIHLILVCYKTKHNFPKFLTRCFFVYLENKFYKTYSLIIKTDNFESIDL